jgi:hypothetical protein
LAALSVTVTVPYLLPTAVGLKAMLIVQLAPALRPAPHVPPTAKSPVAAMFVITSDVLPVLVRLTFWAALLVPTGWPAKLRLFGETVAIGGEAGVPVRSTTCGLPAALSVMVKAPTLEVGTKADGV